MALLNARVSRSNSALRPTIGAVRKKLSRISIVSLRTGSAVASDKP